MRDVSNQTSDLSDEGRMLDQPVSRVSTVLHAIKHKLPVASVELQITFATVLGESVKFCTNKARDPVQRKHLKGRFYESRELELLQKIVPAGAVFVDIGANIGNHSLFFAKFMAAAEVIPFEPNPLAFELLIANTLANELSDVIKLDHLGCGLSDEQSGGFAMTPMHRNLGGAQMLAGEGDLEVFRADELLGEKHLDFIKIDVEGMEIKVLNGLSGILERCRPMIFVEIDDVNADDFAVWRHANKYESVYQSRRYKNNENHLLVDANSATAMREKIQNVQAGKE